MKPEWRTPLYEYLLAMADDELILAHRNSEWTGHGPILEEDIAFSNLAQDELGHASLWYGLIEKLTAEDPDQLVFFRDAADYRPVQMVELPPGDWAFSMLRQYLFDVAEMVRANALLSSAYIPLAEVAAKIRLEEMYHVRHTQLWVKRLGLGTAESHSRMQAALNQLWPYAHQLFVPLPGESLLVRDGVVPLTADWHQAWHGIVQPHLVDAGLMIPADDTPPTTSRQEHTPHLIPLLADMQMVARLDPQAAW